MRDEAYVDDAMRRERKPRDLIRLISRLAERQHNVVTRDALVDAGFHPRRIDRLIGSFLHIVHRGVYAVGHRKLTRQGEWFAAVAAMGEGAVLSGRSAAAHWGMLPPIRGPVDVVAPTQKRAQPGIHPRKAKLGETDRRTRDRIPVTSPERTLLDLAATHPHLLDQAIREAHYLRLTSTAALARCCTRYAHRPGCKALRKAIAQADLDQGPTHEELERRFRAFLKRHKLPLPKFNQLIEVDSEPFKPDCIWHDRRLIVELDSRQAHATPHAFEADRRRDRILHAAGYTVIRVTWRQLHDEPEAVLMALNQFLVDALKAPR